MKNNKMSFLGKKPRKETDIEITAPAGSYESLMAAIESGADSVYFGIEQLNMRAKSTNNFKINDLSKIAKICKKNKVNSYLTLNTIMYDHDLKFLRLICDKAKKSGINAVIASDIAAISYANSIGLKVHISTQANISNIEAVKFYSKFADAVILARELTLKQIKNIVDEIKKQNIKGLSKELIKVEIFVHGALCVAIAGKCYMSLATYNASANRGACLQNCRRAYRVIDEETGDELKIENKYVMSPKDLCTISFIDKILESGVKILKIEGRARAPEYVSKVVRVYREAVDSYFDNSYTKDKVERWIKELESVYNRGFWQGGYYLGKKLGEWSGGYGSKANREKIFIGRATNFYKKANVGEFYLEAGGIKVGDDILITGTTTGVVELKVNSIFLNDKPVVSGNKGDKITIPIKTKIRHNDKLYVVKGVKNA